MITKETTLNEIQQIDKSLGLVLKRYTDNPNNDASSLEHLCQDEGYDPQFLASVLNVFHQQKETLEELKHFSVPVILDYLTRTHSFYLEKRLPEIEQTVEQLMKVMDEEEGHLRDFIQMLHRVIKKDVAHHIQLEERIFFPYVRTLHKALCSDELDNGMVQELRGYSAQIFEQHHDDTLERQLHWMWTYLAKFKPMGERLSPFRILVSQLESFEVDLRVHSLMEEQVLLPRVMELESRVNKRFELW